MRTRIGSGNPFGHDRYGFLWEVLAEREPGAHLDYGAYDGAVLRELSRTGVIARGVGIDVNAQVVAAAQGCMPPNVELVCPGRPGRLPYADGAFHSASLLDVIEHIANHGVVLDEIARVLRPGGVLVVTVPRRHAFSVLDLGNVKFRFPRLHRVAYTLRNSEAEYRARYVDAPNGLVGDVEKEKGWHQHFSEAEMEALLAASGFAVEHFDGSGLFMRVLWLADFVSPRPVQRLLRAGARVDARWFGRANLFCVARRTAAPAPAGRRGDHEAREPRKLAAEGAGRAPRGPWEMEGDAGRASSSNLN